MKRFRPLYCGAYDETLIRSVCGMLGVKELTARALIRRGIDSVTAAEAFLIPRMSQMHDPFLLPDMQQAVLRICRAVETGERICVYGDYDADGICATAIVLNAIEALGGKAFAYIPSRHKEGYGLNEKAVRALAEAYTNLIITVDNGIGAFDEIALCTLLHMDVIVTDHHSAGLSVPDCCAVVSASRKDSRYPNPYLCGAGAAYKLAQALLPDANLSDALALASVATVADVVPLVGENRSIVACGMPYVLQNRGLSALLETAGWNRQQISEQTLGFFIAPRLNAAGRMADAMRGVELIRSSDEERIHALASALERDNQLRKDAEAGILEAAAQAIDESRRAFLLVNQDWNPGVIGIVASRLCEQYSRPVILFTEQDGLLTGSGRSPEGIHLYETLTRFRQYFVRYGGHARAAGVTIQKENFEAFAEDFLGYLDTLDASCFQPVYEYEEGVDLTALTVSSVTELSRLAPFGEGNPEPVFLLENVTLSDVRTMGKDASHLSAQLRQRGDALRLVAFRQGSQCAQLSRAIRRDILIRPTLNCFRERTSVELMMVAQDECGVHRKLFDAIFTDFMYNGLYADNQLAEWYATVADEVTPIRSTEEMRRVYARLRSELGESAVAADGLASRYAPETLLALLVFLELGFFRIEPEDGCVRPAAVAGTHELTDSRLHRLICAAERP